MFLQRSILVLTGCAALAGTVIGCQAQVPTPVPTPSVSVSPTAPTQTTPNSPPISQAPSANSSPPASVVEPESTQPSKPEQSKTARELEKCTVSMARVNDPDAPLNIRSSPNTNSDTNIVGKLENGEFVSVLEQKDGWFRISSPAEGWIAKSRTESACNLKAENVKFGRGEKSAAIADRFVGAGSHQYRFNLAKGQRVSLVSNSGPLPRIITPDGEVLSEVMGEGRSWTGTLPTSGDYILELESNYKGYQYSFTITAE